MEEVSSKKFSDHSRLLNGTEGRKEEKGAKPRKKRGGGRTQSFLPIQHPRLADQKEDKKKKGRRRISQPTTAGSSARRKGNHGRKTRVPYRRVVWRGKKSGEFTHFFTDPKVQEDPGKETRGGGNGECTL